MKMRQKIVGVYDIGFEQVQLVAREDLGGEFYTVPEHGKIARIKIGMDHEIWSQVVSVMLHESFEFLTVRAGARFSPSNEMRRDHTSYLFNFGHTQFTEICAKQAEFLAAALPDLAREWKKWRRAKK